jgi:lipopolysaccharide transport system permease protein
LSYADAGVASPPASILHRVIEPEAAWGLPDLRELWQFRDLLFSLAGRDVKVRYKQTALGVAWIVLQPLLGAGILTFVFGKIGNFNTSFLISFSGMVIWNTFSSALTRSSGVMVGNQQLVSKIYFPRILLPVATLVSTLVDTTVTLVMLAILMLVYHQPPTLYLWLLPAFLLLALILALGIGLFLTALAVRFRDVQYMLPVMTQMLLWASPVAYTASYVIHRVPQYQTLYFLNPLVALIEGFRWVVLGTRCPGAAWIGYSAGVALALLLIGAVFFRRMERDFADVI